jgi:hypothetical protein
MYNKNYQRREAIPIPTKIQSTMTIYVNNFRNSKNDILSTSPNPADDTSKNTPRRTKKAGSSKIKKM